MNKPVLAFIILCCIPSFVQAQIDTTTVVYAWKLDENFSAHLRAPVDTALEGFQQYDPIASYTSVSKLGNYGQPSRANVFTERDTRSEFLPSQAFLPYMQHYNQARYVNTRKPFTRISYFHGGSSQSKEEVLDALHTQNLTKTLNVGLHYTTAASLGQYQFQKVKNNAFGFFSSLTGTVYSYHANINYNKITADENGGVTADSLITDSTFTHIKDIPMLFTGTDNPPKHYPDVFSEIRNLNLFTMQELAFRKKKNPADSTAIRKVTLFYPKLVYIFSLDRTSRLFTDIKPSVGLDAGLYQGLLFNSEQTADSLVYWKMHHTARLQFQGRRNNHYFMDYSYEMTQYSLMVNSSGSDTIPEPWFISDAIKLPDIHYKNRLYNTSVSSGFNRVFANHVELNLFGKYYLAGYRNTDFTLAGDLRLYTGKPGRQASLLFSLRNELHTPDFLYTHYASNTFLWTNNFKKTSSNHLSANLSLDAQKLQLQGDYFLFTNYIYFNRQAYPTQYHGGLSVLSLRASKRFDFWHISSTTTVVYQKTDNDNVLGIPDLALMNSTWLQQPVHFKATDGHLLLLLGFDLHYNTAYYADAYMPSLTTFYRQSDKKLGNYPYFDVFLNVKLKRLRFFLKSEHVNSGWIDKNYFSVLHYPQNPRNLKFGLSWTFYD